MAGVCFSKPEVVIAQPWFKSSQRNLVCFSKERRHPVPNWKYNCATTAAILKIDKISLLSCRWPNFNAIWQAHAQ